MVWFYFGTEMTLSRCLETPPKRIGKQKTFAAAFRLSFNAFCALIVAHA
jgi:hypothetical protein